MKSFRILKFSVQLRITRKELSQENIFWRYRNLYVRKIFTLNDFQTSIKIKKYRFLNYVAIMIDIRYVCETSFNMTIWRTNIVQVYIVNTAHYLFSTSFKLKKKRCIPLISLLYNIIVLRNNKFVINVILDFTF